MSKPVIKLYDLNSLGLIISFPSGVLYTNQTGGVACCHPLVEGVLVPLDDDCNVESKLAEFFGYHGGKLQDADADALDAILRTPDGPRIVSPLFFVEVDRARLSDSMEAWLYVTVVACPDEHMISYWQHGDGELSDIQTLSGRAWSPADQPELGRYATLYPFSGFGRTSAVLTWCNSD